MSSLKLTATLRFIVAVLALLVVGATGAFAYNVYVDRQAARLSTPPLRVIASYEDVVRSQPNVAAYRVRLGEAYAAAGMFPEAIAQLNAAIQLDDKHTGAYLDLGIIAMANNRVPEATKYFRKVVELTDASAMRNTDSKRGLALYNLGKMALEGQEYEQAAGFLKEALRVRKDASDTYLLLARAFQGLEDYDSAIKYVGYSLAFDPNFAQANYTAGELHLEKGDFLKASGYIRKAIDTAPDERAPKELLMRLGTLDSWLEKARAQLKADSKDALSSIKIARRIDPQSLEAALLHARVLEKRGMRKEALVTYREALELDKTDKRAEAAIARLEAQDKRKDEDRDN